jgi:hypothetical protein
MKTNQTADGICDDKWNSEEEASVDGGLIYSPHAIASDTLEFESTISCLCHTPLLAYNLNFYRQFSPFSQRLSHFRTLMESLFVALFSA